MSKTHANRLISSATVVETLGDAAVKPLNESQVRPLAALPPERQADAWEAALKGSKGKVTAAHVQAVVDDMLHASDGKARPRTTPIRWVDRARLVADLKQFCTRHKLRLPEAVWKYLQNY